MPGEVTVTADVVSKEPDGPILKVPPLMVVVPVYVSTPVSAKVPVPVSVKPPDPLITPE